MRSLGRVVVATLVAGITFATVSLTTTTPAVAAYWSCVPYARHVSDVNLQGDAWRWWDAASGVYAKGSRPREGAILVFKRTRGLSRGHVAVVRQVVDARTILIDHANWGAGRKGKIDSMVAVRDVSPNNDWSATRVRYTPIGDFGNTTYPTYGFIYDRNARPGEAQTARAAGPRGGAAATAPAAGPRMTPLPVAAKATGTYLPGERGSVVWSAPTGSGAAGASAANPGAVPRIAVAPAVPLPTPKPLPQAAGPNPGPAPDTAKASVLPTRKPNPAAGSRQAAR